MPSTKPDVSAPVSSARVTECLRSARFWVDELPLYANRMQRWADVWAISAGILAAITSLAVWPVLGDAPTNEAKIIVSVGALLSATCAVVPRVMNFGERAGAARELASRYGSVLGSLLDLHHVSVDGYPGAAIKAVTDFESAKEKKDALRRVGSRQEIAAKRRTDEAPKAEARMQGVLKEEQADLAKMQGVLKEQHAHLANNCDD